jgi:hypothetical protein
MTKRFTRILGFAVAVAFIGAVAAPASAFIGLAASWMVTYYIDPTGSMGATQCINFNKTTESHGVITGTWNSPTFSGWSGQWVQKGEHYAWHGFYTSTSATYEVGDIINRNVTAETSAATLSFGSGGTTTLDTATATMVQVKNCPTGRFHKGPSPFREF